MTPPPALPSTSSGTAPAFGPPRTLPRSVFLIGAQATGKTELFEAVRREFAGSPAVEEVARKVMSERGWTGADTGREGRQEVLFWETVREENIAAGPLGAREVTTSTENLHSTEVAILSDRAALCALVYSNIAEQSLLPSDRHQYTRLLALLRSPACAPTLARYRAALVVLCEPVDVSWFADDGLRGIVDVEGWETVRMTYRKVLEEVGVEYRVLGRELVELGERVDWVKRELGVAE